MIKTKRLQVARFGSNTKILKDKAIDKRFYKGILLCW